MSKPSSTPSLSRPINEDEWFKDVFGHDEGKKFTEDFLPLYSLTYEHEEQRNLNFRRNTPTTTTESIAIPSTANITRTNELSTVLSPSLLDDDLNYDKILISKVTDEHFPIGHFFTPTLQDMINKVETLYTHIIPKLHTLASKHTPSVTTANFSLSSDSLNNNNPLGVHFEHFPINDILSLHAKKPGATIQAASQFNCLEFVSANVTPEEGITGYAYDYTQGPACALACAAGTLYRNYMVNIREHTNTDNVLYHHQINTITTKNPPKKNDNTAIIPRDTVSSLIHVPPQIGQNRHYQIHTLDTFETLLQNKDKQYFYVKNGYLQSTKEDLQRLNQYLATVDDMDTLRKSIKVGVHSNVGVVLSSRSSRPSASVVVPRLTQVYCSAIPMNHFIPDFLWEPLSCLILEAAYETTIWTGIYRHLLHYLHYISSSSSNTLSNDIFDRPTYSNEIYLTLLGGGVFANPYPWILGSIAKAVVRIEQRLQYLWDRYTKNSSITSTSSSSTTIMCMGMLRLPPINVYLCHYRYINEDIQTELNEFINRYRKNATGL